MDLGTVLRVVEEVVAAVVDRIAVEAVAEGLMVAAEAAAATTKNGHHRGAHENHRGVLRRQSPGFFPSRFSYRRRGDESATRRAMERRVWSG
ncbi:MAG: hypothetical protein WDM87_12260 [Terracidiphilus sp.]